MVLSFYFFYAFISMATMDADFFEPGFIIMVLFIAVIFALSGVFFTLRWVRGRHARLLVKKFFNFAPQLE
jgi:cell division protein FtsL